MVSRSWRMALIALPWLASCSVEEPGASVQDTGAMKPRTAPPPAAPEQDNTADGEDGTPDTPEIAASSAELKFVAGVAPSESTCTCTRRPDGVPSRQCPWGTGATITESVAAAGGSVELSGSGQTASVAAKLTIPAGALSKSTSIALTELATPPPRELVDYSPVYKIEPLDLSLATPARISLPGSNLSQMIPPAVAVYYAPALSEPFVRVTDSYQNAGFYQASAARGGYYIVAVPSADLTCPSASAEAPFAISKCPCTRRAGAPEGARCAPGAGVSQSASIDSLGGMVEVSGTAATRGTSAAVTIPAAALSQRTSVVLTELSAPPPGGFVDHSPVYRLEPLSLTLSAPGAIKLPWTYVDGAVPQALSIYYTPSADQPFMRMPDSYINAGFNQATLLHGGYYFVGYPSSLLLTQCE